VTFAQLKKILTLFHSNKMKNNAELQKDLEDTIKSTIMKSLFFSLLFFSLFLTFLSSSCKRDPYIPDFDHAGGYVIGKEVCKADTAQDNWLIDLSIDYSAANTFGDTITINGTTYNHMVKTTQLLPQFHVIGKRVAFDCHFSSSKVQTTGCTISNPITYNLKEMTVLSTGEIR
jgi:hypothetical protein